MSNKKHSDLAWYAMALGILTYDVIAIKTNKFETMSTALWRSLAHPVRSPVIWVSWGILTHHLFASKNARNSMKTLSKTILKKDKI